MVDIILEISSELSVDIEIWSRRLAIGCQISVSALNLPIAKDALWPPASNSQITKNGKRRQKFFRW